MPASLKLAETFGDDLAVIFIECQALAREEAEAFAYQKKWMGTPAMWTSERPCTTGSRGLPSCALLSNEGKVLLKGHPLAMEKQIEEAIKKEIKLSKQGPDSVPKSLKGAWKDFAKDKYTSALAAVEKVAASDEEEEARAAEETRALFKARIETRVKSLEWMVENGRYLEAAERADSLAKALKGLEEFEPRVAALKEKLASSELKDEVAAEKAFDKLEKKVHADGLEGGLKKLLEKFQEKYAGTKAAERAAHLVKLAG